MAAIALGDAINAADGTLSQHAITSLSVAGLAAIAALALARLRINRERSTHVLWAVLAGGLVFQLGALLMRAPGQYPRHTGPDALSWFNQGIAVAAVLTGALLVGSDRSLRWTFPLLVATHFALGIWMIHASLPPRIDVFTFQHESSHALLHGINPYKITFKDIYSAYEDSVLYGPNMVVGGRLQFGFVYPPLSLLLALPGYLLGDCRYSQLFAIDAAALLMGYAGRSRYSLLAAAVFLLTPRGFFVLEQSWTEPFAVLLVAGVVFAACRAPKLLPYALGLLFAVKQYMVLAVIPALLLVPSPWRMRPILRLFGPAIAVAALITFPFVLWSPSAFWKDVVALQFHQPFRLEALSYPAWAAVAHRSWPPPSLGFAAAGFASLIGVLLLPRTAAGFAAALAFILWAFFAFNKQAFANYYFLVIGVFCAAVAASGGRPVLDSPRPD